MINADVNCADTVEAGVHPADTQVAGAKATGGLPADLHNAGAYTRCYRENRSPTLHLPVAVVASFTCTTVHRPICFPTYRLDHCCNHLPHRYCYQSLSTEPYVSVISLDFSEAFDTVRHSKLLQKLAKLDIPDHNWLVDFFNNSHCTVFGGELSHTVARSYCKHHPGISHLWTCCVRRYRWRPRCCGAGKLVAQVCR